MPAEYFLKLRDLRGSDRRPEFFVVPFLPVGLRLFEAFEQDLIIIKFPRDGAMTDVVAGVTVETLGAAPGGDDGQDLISFVERGTVAFRQPDDSQIFCSGWRLACGMTTVASGIA